ncbi:MAG: D-tyrosyl-tRNA(Tyr) deacylase [Sandaracinus sp.]|nr:D-tyrosyl-tRNA(Tyr) deacylase [Myxococcales bacterium]MCB9602685.1 D-tyrosyl-tRNA(Tyr) deacylase [Sandaracinus sp.]MCB9632101.1 D-tyrosyl-tRNA(Tyr) deacylase [Sandaracinus sp.]
MRAVVQRVARASVTVGDEVVGAIDHGLLVYLGAGRGDTPTDVEYVASKVAGLRVFENDAGQMDLAVTDVGGSVLVVSQFTLFGDVRRGRRPSFTEAADPSDAVALYESFVANLRARGLTVATGRFRASMLVDAAVRGPVTILLDSRKTF